MVLLLLLLVVVVVVVALGVVAVVVVVVFVVDALALPMRAACAWVAAAAVVLRSSEKLPVAEEVNIEAWSVQSQEGKSPVTTRLGTTPPPSTTTTTLSSSSIGVGMCQFVFGKIGGAEGRFERCWISFLFLCFDGSGLETRRRRQGCWGSLWSTRGVSV